jgi:hypothetical protein
LINCSLRSWITAYLLICEQKREAQGQDARFDDASIRMIGSKVRFLIKMHNRTSFA